MTEPRDQELEDYLAGKSPVSRLYRQLPEEMPPPELDARIRDAARQPLRASRPRWMLPLSAAAVVMLSVSVLMQMQQEGVVPVPVDQELALPQATEAMPDESMPDTGRADPTAVSPVPRAKTRAAEARLQDSPNAVVEPFPMAPEEVTVPAPVSRQQTDQDEQQAPAKRERTESLMSAPAAEDSAGASAERMRDPELWIGYIRQLRDAGRNEEVARELEAFKVQYPEYPLPDDLRTEQP